MVTRIYSQLAWLSGLALATAVLSFAFINPVQAAQTLDFGDAPDGNETRYTSGASTGSFPSLLANDGARAGEVDIVWLGQKVDKEADSKQVNYDLFDDGMGTTLNKCATSTVVFIVRKAEPTTDGVAFLNGWADWDKNGEWSGTDPNCPAGVEADEWAIRNFPIDLAAQKKKVKAYSIEIMAGSNTKGIWKRATVSLNQRMLDEAGSGLINVGEVEDYGPIFRHKKKKKRKYAAYCSPNRKIIQHGKTGTLKIRKRPGSEKIKYVKRSPLTKRLTKRRLIYRKVGSKTVFKVKSRQKDKPKRTQFETLRFNTHFKGGKVRPTRCKIAIVHENIKDGRIQDKENKTRTKLQAVTFKYGTPENRQLQIKITMPEQNEIATELVQLELAGINHIVIPLESQFPPLPDPLQTQTWVNGGASPWQCDTILDPLTGQPIIDCLGNDPLAFGADSFFDVFFDVEIVDPDQLHVQLFNGDTPVGALDMPVIDPIP